MSIKLQYCYGHFPRWAMSGLINDDRSGIEDSDEKLLDEFLSQHDDVVCWDYPIDEVDNGGFSNYPLFGLATDCCTIFGYIKSEVTK